MSRSKDNKVARPWDAPREKESTAQERTPDPALQQPKARPEGWPVGSFATYAKAQAAVTALSETEGFPVEKLTIAGVDLIEVERVVGRLSWPKVLLRGALSGAWMGLFFGLLISFFNMGYAPIALGMGLGIVFGIVSAAVPYALSRRQRGFATTSEIVAGRYDILCDPDYARQARDIISAHLGSSTRPHKVA